MTNEQKETYTPDPAWDYYTLWHNLIHIKAKIDRALDLMKTFENATDTTDSQIRETLEPALDNLVDISNELEVENE